MQAYQTRTGTRPEFSDLTKELGVGRGVAMGLFVLALVMLTCAQIIVTSQATDGLIVSLIGGSWALQYYPDFQLISSQQSSLMPFPEGVYAVSLGFGLNAAICIFLGKLDLGDNLVPQYFSSILTAISLVIVVFFLTFSDLGGDGVAPLPKSIEGMSPVLGVVVFNFAYIIAVPSMFSDAQPRVHFRGAMWSGIGMFLFICCCVGFAGSAGLRSAGDNVLVTLYAIPSPIIVRAAVFSYFTALLLPIPVYSILLRRNLAYYTGVRSAGFLSLAVPWSVACICYMQHWFGTIVNWSSLICLGFVNYTVPLCVVNNFVGDKRRRVLAQVCLMLTTSGILGAIVQNIREA